MIRPTPEVTKALAASVRQYPVIAEWFAEWRMHELEQLPNVAQNTALAQGLSLIHISEPTRRS